MIKSSRICSVAAACVLMVLSPSPAEAQSHGAAAERKLLGKHMFSLQWVSWERFGVAEFKRGAAGLELKARQEMDGNWVTAQGRVEAVDDKRFYLDGEIVTRVGYINQGQPCVRQGRFEFLATGKRQYWRMQDMQNPCDQATDYVDVYFRKTR